MARSTRRAFDAVLRQAVDEAPTDADGEYGPVETREQCVPMRRPNASRTAVDVLPVPVPVDTATGAPAGLRADRG
ncbi:hypothetical protein EBF04_19940 [Streptomyces sp. I6]|nr:hypothetical protein EBF04_19940 [Streptomyces sp. I6]